MGPGAELGGHGRALAEGDEHKTLCGVSHPEHHDPVEYSTLYREEGPVCWSYCNTSWCCLWPGLGILAPGAAFTATLAFPGVWILNISAVARRSSSDARSSESSSKRWPLDKQKAKFKPCDNKPVVFKELSLNTDKVCANIVL